MLQLSFARPDRFPLSLWQWIVNAAQGNQVGLVSGTYFVVTLFNAAVTNNAAVSIFFPIAWEVAAQSKMDFYPILLTLMFAGKFS